jgi:hypothetical protein
VIISLAIDPFIQNLVAYPQLPIATGQSAIARINVYSLHAPGGIRSSMFINDTTTRTNCSY